MGDGFASQVFGFVGGGDAGEVHVGGDSFGVGVERRGLISFFESGFGFDELHLEIGEDGVRGFVFINIFTRRGGGDKEVRQVSPKEGYAFGISGDVVGVPVRGYDASINAVGGLGTNDG